MTDPAEYRAAIAPRLGCLPECWRRRWRAHRQQRVGRAYAFHPRGTRATEYGEYSATGAETFEHDIRGVVRGRMNHAAIHQRRNPRPAVPLRPSGFERPPRQRALELVGGATRKAGAS